MGDKYLCTAQLVYVHNFMFVNVYEQQQPREHRNKIRRTV